MTHNDRRYVEALCMGAAATCEALIPESGIAPGSARALAAAHRRRAAAIVERQGVTVVPDQIAALAYVYAMPGQGVVS